jgi:hypothetical protein
MMKAQTIRMIHVKWVPCHHSMMRPQVPGEDGLQTCRVAVNILNKQSWTGDKGLSSSLWLGGGANNDHLKKTSMIRYVTQGLSKGWGR